MPGHPPCALSSLIFPHLPCRTVDVVLCVFISLSSTIRFPYSGSHPISSASSFASLDAIFSLIPLCGFQGALSFLLPLMPCSGLQGFPIPQNDTVKSQAFQSCVLHLCAASPGFLHPHSHDSSSFSLRLIVSCDVRPRMLDALLQTSGSFSI